MAYSPPGGDTVDFDLNGQAYTPPSGGSVDFSLADIFRISSPVMSITVLGLAVTPQQDNFPTTTIASVPAHIFVSIGAATTPKIWSGISPIGRIFTYGSVAEIANRAPVTIQFTKGNIVLSGAVVNPTIRRVYFPMMVFPGMTSDAGSITIPIAALPGLTQDSANANDGDWRSIYQSLMLCLHEYLESYTTVWDRPQTVKSFMLEDWNRNNSKFGRHMKRLFLVEFTVENSPTNVFNSGE